jgi:hypothetical protein
MLLLGVPFFMYPTTVFKKLGGNATGVSLPPPCAMYVCSIFLVGELGSFTVRTTKDPDSMFGGIAEAELRLRAGDGVLARPSTLERVAISKVLFELGVELALVATGVSVAKGSLGGLFVSV